MKIISKASEEIVFFADSSNTFVMAVIGPTEQRKKKTRDFFFDAQQQ